jgi:hypothetical protein
LKIVLDRAQLVALVLAGVRSGAWEYEDPERGAQGWATKESPSAAVRLAEDTFLHPRGTYRPPEPAEEGAAVCPFCGGSHPSRPCPGTGVGDQAQSGSRFSASGAAGKAFIDARAPAAEARRQELHELVVHVSASGGGTGTELARLQSIVPPSALGARLIYDLDVTVALGDPAESARVEYHGSPADYAPLRDALRQLLGSHQAVLDARLRAIFAPPLALSGEEVGRLAQAAADTGRTRCSLTIATEES